jgi:hypothetical protein
MIQIVAAILAALGLFLLLRSVWIRTGLTMRQTVLTLVAAGVVLALIVLAATGRLNWLVAAAAALLPFVNRLAPLLKVGALLHRLFPGWHRHLRSGLGGGAAAAGTAKAGDDVSRTETAWLRMTLHHASGRMDGEVLAGRYRGRFLSELGMAELLGLLAECGDFDSARLLESYLDRAHPDWRRADSPHTESSGAATMTRAEAFEILGLSEGATESEIVAAHRRLMQRLHPDRGGSTFLAAQINAARQVLLS